jgi:hypothetical protein
MITTKKLFGALIALSMGVFMVSCAGEDGEQGPAGPAGNANVNSSNYTVLMGDWTTGATLRDTLSVSAITQNVVDNGAVMVYLKIDGDTVNDNWQALTYTRAITGLNVSGHPAQVEMSIEYGYNVGMLLLSVKNNINQDLTSIVQMPPNDYMFKVVVVPSASLVEGVNVNDYEQVSNVYGIQEFDM